MNIRFLFFIIFFPSILNAQFIEQEYVFSEYASMNFKEGVHANSMTFLAGSYGSCRDGAVSLVSAEGSFVGNFIVAGGYWDVDDIEHDYHNSRIVGSGTWYGSDDIPDPNNGTAAFSMDLSGNVIHFNVFPEAGLNPWDEDKETHIAHLDNEENVLGFEKKLIFLDNQLDSISEVELTSLNDEIKDIETLNDSTILVYTTTELVRLDYDGNELQYESFTSTIEDVYFDSQKIYVLKSDELMVQDIATNSIINITSYSSYLSPNRITGNSSSLFLYSSSNNSPTTAPILEMEKATLSYENDFMIDNDGLSLSFLIATEDNLQLIGKENGFQPYLKSKTLDTPLTFTGMDIEISNLLIKDSLQVVDTVDTGPGGPLVIEFGGANVDYEFEVTNMGSIPIQEFSIRYNTGFQVNCVSGTIVEDFSGFNILPGESQIFESDVYVSGGFIPNFDPPELISNFAIRAFAPNHLIEDDSDNNTQSASIYSVTSNSELGLPIESLSIFPNPVSESFTIDLALTESLDQLQVHLYNSLGQQVRSFEKNNILDMKEDVSVEDLPSGIYWLSLITNKGIVTKSIQVE